MSLIKVRALYDLSSTEFTSKNSFKEFFEKRFLGKDIYSEGLGAILVCKIVDTLKKNPDWIEIIGEFLSPEDQKSKFLLEALAGALSYRYVSPKDVYYTLSKGFIKSYTKQKTFIDHQVHSAFKEIVPFISSYMTVEERKGFYEHLGGGHANIGILKMLVDDYQSKVFDKDFLISTLLWPNFDEKDIKLIDNTGFIKLLASALAFVVKNGLIYRYHNELLNLLKALSSDDFKTLIQEVHKLVPKASSLSNEKYSQFIMYSLDIIDNLHINLHYEDFSYKRRLNEIDSFMSDIAFLIPHLESQKFWKFAQYLKSLVGKKSAYLAYLLNNDCIVEDRKFMLSVLKLYLESNEERKLPKHKLLIDVQILDNLSPRLVTELAKRSVNGNTTIRFRFTKEAFEILKAKLISTFLVNSSPEIREKWEKLILLCEEELL